MVGVDTCSAAKPPAGSEGETYGHAHEGLISLLNDVRHCEGCYQRSTLKWKKDWGEMWGLKVAKWCWTRQVFDGGRTWIFEGERIILGYEPSSKSKKFVGRCRKRTAAGFGRATTNKIGVGDVEGWGRALIQEALLLLLVTIFSSSSSVYPHHRSGIVK